MALSGIGVKEDEFTSNEPADKLLNQSIKLKNKQKRRAAGVLNAEGLKNEVDFLQCCNNQEMKKISKKFCSKLHRTKGQRMRILGGESFF